MCERGRERDTVPEVGSRLQGVSTEPKKGLELTNCEMMTWAEVRCLTHWATQVPHILSTNVTELPTWCEFYMRFKWDNILKELSTKRSIWQALKRWWQCWQGWWQEEWGYMLTRVFNTLFCNYRFLSHLSETEVHWKNSINLESSIPWEKKFNSRWKHGSWN